MSSTVPVTATVLSKTEAWLGTEFNSKDSNFWFNAYSWNQMQVS